METIEEDPCQCYSCRQMESLMEWSRADFDIRTMEAESNYYGLRSAYYMLRRCGFE